MLERDRIPSFVVAILGSAWCLAGCPGGGDDDDLSDDDDLVGDDDDSVGDDDDGFEYSAVTLRGSLLAVALSDDDSAGDDDDAAGDDDDSAVGGMKARDESTVEGAFVLDYWRDFDAQLLECRQTLSWAGTVEFSPAVVADCAGCTGVLTLDGGSVLDSSNRAVDPSACDPADFGAAQNDLGSILTANGPGTAGGGLLQLALMDLDTAIDLGVQPSRSGNFDLASQAAQVAATGNQMTHIGFVSSAGSTFFDQIDFDTSAGASGAGETWSVFWFLFRPEGQGADDATLLSGAYQLGSFWILQ